jgi:16S rRNA (guanine966-N2)-methyltransferase
MRIVAGEFRSRLLVAPRGLATRPTTDRLRETLFNVLQPRMEGTRFLDLYAGSGGNGLEALSRGAVEAVFVEQAGPALEALRKNVAALGVESRVRVEGLAVSRWLGNAVRAAEVRTCGLVFLDPPYEAAREYEETLGLLGGVGQALLAPGGLVAVEHRRVRAAGGRQRAGAVAAYAPAEAYGGLRRTRVLEQGDAALSFYALRNPTD